MTQKIFVNLPVSDLKRATDFYKAVGATQDMDFSDDTSSGLAFSDNVNVMLHTPEKFAQFTGGRATANAAAAVGVLLCISVDDRKAADSIADKAAKGGGRADPVPQQDHGFMYMRSFEDPDGHIWEVLWIDEQAARQAMRAGKQKS